MCARARTFPSVRFAIESDFAVVFMVKTNLFIHIVYPVLNNISPLVFVLGLHNGRGDAR